MLFKKIFLVISIGLLICPLSFASGSGNESSASEEGGAGHPPVQLDFDLPDGISPQDLLTQQQAIQEMIILQMMGDNYWSDHTKHYERIQTAQAIYRSACLAGCKQAQEDGCVTTDAEDDCRAELLSLVANATQAGCEECMALACELTQKTHRREHLASSEASLVQRRIFRTSEESQTDCPICRCEYEEAETLVVYPCGHSLCEACYKQAKVHDPRCSLCRHSETASCEAVSSSSKDKDDEEKEPGHDKKRSRLAPTS